MQPRIFIASPLLAGNTFLTWLVMRPVFDLDPLQLSQWTLVEPMLNPPRGSRPPDPAQDLRRSVGALIGANIGVAIQKQQHQRQQNLKTKRGKDR